MSAINNFFMTLVADSPEWMAKVNAAQNPADIVRMGASAGYAFTEEAVTSLMTSLRAGLEDLPPDELAAATGGIQVVSGSPYACYITQLPHPATRPLLGGGFGGSCPTLP
ncbi:MAG: Nif11 family protein [Pseudomonadota bacterium]